MRICPHVKFDAKTSRDTARRPVFQKTQRDAKTRSPALTPVINETLPGTPRPEYTIPLILYFPLNKKSREFPHFCLPGQGIQQAEKPRRPVRQRGKHPFRISVQLRNRFVGISVIGKKDSAPNSRFQHRTGEAKDSPISRRRMLQRFPGGKPGIDLSRMGRVPASGNSDAYGAGRETIPDNSLLTGMPILFSLLPR